MLSGSSFSRRFAASAALAFSMAGLSPVMANEPPAQKTPADVKAPAEKPAPKRPLPVIDYEALYNTEKFKFQENYILKESVRSGLTSAGLRKAAKENIDNYVQSLEPEKTYTQNDLLVQGIKGMFTSLTPHDDYFDPEEMKDFRESTDNSFIGIGVQIDLKDKKIKVIEPISGGPSEKAGIIAGDVIIEVNGQNLEGMEPNAAIRTLRGEPGSQANIKLLRNGAVVGVTVIREEIKQSSVRYRMLEGGIAYFHIKEFTRNVSFDLRQAVAQAKADAELDPVIKAAGGLKGAIQDYTFDGGGLLDEAREISDDLIDAEGLIVSQQSREDTERLTASKGDILKGLPVVVLVNEASASASEIVAAALQDHERAVIMGSTTFGKGTVQSVSSDGSKMTVAIFRRPSGGSNQWVGVVPDVEVKTRDKDYEAFQSNASTERTLPNSLPNVRDIDSQKGTTKAVCSPVREGIKVEEAGTDKNIFKQAGDRSPFEVGELNPLMACARDYILKQHNPTYTPRFTVTAPKAPALTN